MKKLVLFAFICVHSRLMAVQPWFEPNEGQAHSSVQFLSRDVYLASNKAAIPVGGEKPIVMDLIGAHKNLHAEGLDPQPGITSYFLGNDPKKWHAGVPHYGRVRYKDVYPGIDLIYYHNANDLLEYDFIVKPGAEDPNAIRLSYNYSVRLDSNGDLVIAGLRQKRPRVYQDGHEIACHYLVRGKNQVQLALATYDISQTLTVDPVLEYSTYLGGPAFESGVGVQVDSTGFMYVGLFERVPSNPTLNPFQQTSGASYAAFAVKLTPDGKGIVWYVYVGGTADTYTEAMAIDSAGNVYLTGQTRCLDFPVKNAVQTTYGGGFNDSYVAKISADGRSIAYATYLGGSSDDDGSAIAVDASGAAYVGGYTHSLDFPIKNALQGTNAGGADGFVTKLSLDGKLVFSTFLGGSALDDVHGLALDSAGGIYLTGYTASDDFPTRNAVQPIRGGRVGSASAYVTKLTPSADSIVYSTFLGGTAGSGGWAVAVDSAGSAFVCGITGGGLNVKNAFQATYGGGQADIFLARINPSGSDLIFSTYFGGSDLDFQNASTLALDSSGNVYVTGFTYSSDFPLKNSLHSFIGATSGYKTDAFVAKFSPIGGLIYSTLIGGHGDDRGGGITVDQDGGVYITGLTTSEDFPLKNPFQSIYGGGNGDAFIVKLGPDVLPTSPFTSVPGTVQFRYVLGDATPADQKLSITGGSSFTVTTAGSPWLSASPPSGLSPATITVSAKPAGLAPAIYQGTVRVSAMYGGSNPLDISVTLSVLAPAPVINTISPNVVPLNSAGTTFTITGSGFTSSSAVSFDGSTTLPTTFVDVNTLQFSLSKDFFTFAATLSIVVVTAQTAPSNAVYLTIGTPPPLLQAATNAASFATGPVAPGEMVSIFGTNLDQSVTFDGTPATPFYFSSTQVNVTVPYSITGPTTHLQIGASSVQLQVAPSAPGIFATVLSDGGIVTLYTTGCGTLTTDALPLCMLPSSIAVNSEPAQVLYAGIAPGLVEGADQINFVLPADIQSGTISIVWTVGNTSSQPFSFTLP